VVTVAEAEETVMVVETEEDTNSKPKLSNQKTIQEIECFFDLFSESFTRISFVSISLTFQERMGLYQQSMFLLSQPFKKTASSQSGLASHSFFLC
jgi:hypothetical protein